MGKATAILSVLGRLVPQNQVNKTYPLPTVSVFYHTVEQDAMPIIKGLYRNITPLEFERDLDYLLRNFKDKFELSFDDGLSSCSEVIAPILKRKGIEATFFLNTAFIDNKDLFYRYKAALIAESCQRNPLLLQKLQPLVKAPLIAYLYQINYQNRFQLNNLAKHAEIDFDDYLKNNQPYLNSTQIKSLLADGFKIGAHSIDHPPFFELDEANQIEQIKSSVQHLTTHFNLPYKYFSFPFTDWGLSANLFTYIYEHKIVDATWGCAGLKHDTHPKHTQRIPLDAGYFNAEQAIKTEWLYYQLKKIVNKNTIYRF